jgi:hypothetical protein
MAVEKANAKVVIPLPTGTRAERRRAQSNARQCSTKSKSLMLARAKPHGWLFRKASS